MPGRRDGLTDRKELCIINVSLRKLYVNSTMLKKHLKVCGNSYQETQNIFMEETSFEYKYFSAHRIVLLCDNKRTG